MRKEKDYTIALLIGLFIFACLVSCEKQQSCISQPHTYETDDTNFRNGEMLLPDYVHSDTLIVVDAEYLNECIQRPDIASDDDIIEILNETTIKY